MVYLIRPLSASDILQVQECNLKCLPENYQFKYYLYHFISWPHASFVAEAEGQVVGYVLTKLEDEGLAQCRGHITSLAVSGPFRKLGIAENLMKAAEKALHEVYKVTSITLHVRVSNSAATRLYREKLGFEVYITDQKYYADGEDAFGMRKFFS